MIHVARSPNVASIKQPKELVAREMTTQQGPLKTDPLQMYTTKATVPNHVQFATSDDKIPQKKNEQSELSRTSPGSTGQAYRSDVTNHSTPASPVEALPTVPPLPNGVASLLPEPTNPNSLIGVLPNGVHVSRVPYSPAVKSALKKALPTHEDVIKAANLTAQLTLQCMVKINAKNKSIVSGNSRDSINSPPPLLLSRNSQVVEGSYRKTISESVSELTKVQMEDSSSTPKGSKVDKPSKKTGRRKRNHTVLEDHGQIVEDNSLEARKDTKSKKTRKRKRTVVKDDQRSSEEVPDLSKSEDILFARKRSKVMKQSRKTNRQRTNSVLNGDTQIIQESFPEATPQEEKQNKPKKKRILTVVKDDVQVGEEGVSTLLPSFELSSPVDDSQLASSQEQSRKRKQNDSDLEDDSSSISSDISSRRLASMNASACVSAMIKPEPKKAKSILKLDPSAIINTAGKRMASLNARACVSAMMESEKFSSKSAKNSSSKTKVRKSPSPSVRGIPPHPSTLTEFPIVPATGGQINTTASGPFVCLNLGPKTPEGLSEPLEQPLYNTLGMLYNGSAIHPTKCRVFYTSLDRELSLPKFVSPTLVPSRVDYIGAMVEKAIENRRQRKGAKSIKGDNGWTTIGTPIKSIDYIEDDHMHTKKYYIGIQRKRDFVYVRDCILVRSEREDKPYVAKVASIWKEEGGIMVTLFWYYRPDEVIDGAAMMGLNFHKNELLASQHYDVNSVACIEEKCRILGLKQYCRYQCRIVGSKLHYTQIQPQLSTIPELPSRSHNTPYVGHLTPTVDHTTSCDDHMSYVDLGPTMDELIFTDPSLIFLCHRGYNHITGRLVTVPTTSK